jgi:hypothetical protein
MNTLFPVHELAARLFRAVYANSASQVLLLHRGQGFCQTLEASFVRFLKFYPALPELYKVETWGQVAVQDPALAGETLIQVTPQVTYYRPCGVPGWFRTLRSWAKTDTHKVRIIDLRDIPPDLLASDMTGVSLGFAEKNPKVCLRTLGYEFSYHGRNDLTQCLFLLPSDDLGYLTNLRDAIARAYDTMPHLMVHEG